MPTSKRAAAKKSTSPGNEPVASRPIIPPAYGVPRNNKNLLPWAHVEARMAAARVYWVTAVSPQGRPHAVPVDGVWLDGALYFGGDPSTRRQRYLKTNSAANVHLESGYDVVSMNGDVKLAPSLPRPVAEALADASNAKYGYGVKADEYVQHGAAVFRPREVYAWKDMMKDATRWRFER